jgi:hypothetical protein
MYIWVSEPNLPVRPPDSGLQIAVQGEPAERKTQPARPVYARLFTLSASREKLGGAGHLPVNQQKPQPGLFTG